MRKWIDLCENLHETLPDVLYHGTSDYQWDKQTIGTLYLTKDRQDAALYAEEAVIADLDQLNVDWEEGMAMPTRAIIVEFRGTDLISLQSRFMPDWGWDQADDSTTWQESLQAVGSFCISDFNEKHLGAITPAFDENNI